MGLIQRKADALGLVTDLHWDEHTQELHVERVQDVEPVLERIKRQKAEGFDGYNEDRSMRAIAEIPVTIAEQWAKEGVDIFNPDHSKECERRLNDPALRGFRIGDPVTNAGIIIVKR